MPNLFYRLSFGLIGRATLGEGLIHHIGDLPQPRIGVRTLGKSRIKTRFVWFGDGQFIIHLTALFIQWLNLYNSKISSTPVLFLPITRKHTQTVGVVPNYFPGRRTFSLASLRGNRMNGRLFEIGGRIVRRITTRRQGIP